MNVTSRSETRIPPIIHYCWFGGGEKHQKILDCIQTWKMMSDYQIIEWNESNCSFDENEYIRKAYAEKKWAFVSDFYRLKALYEIGGIYLDADVKVYKSFDSLLHHELFLNFIFNCSVGTAVMGAKPKSKVIGDLLDMYNRACFADVPSPHVIVEESGKLLIGDYVPNNYFFTYYFLKKYPQFKLNNKYQDLNDFAIYPKELFEIGSLLHRHYAIHLCIGTWQTSGDTTDSYGSKIKMWLSHFPCIYDYVRIMVRKMRYYQLNRTIPFYEQYLAQKQHKPLPPL